METDPFSRDIPLPLVTSGCDNSGNLRELALSRMKDFGAVCRDVRYREVGVRTRSFRITRVIGFLIDLSTSRSTKSTTRSVLSL